MTNRFKPGYLCLTATLEAKMKQHKIIRFILVAILLSAPVMAQMVDELEVREITEKYDLGITRAPSVPLLDLSRFTMNHSYGVTFFSSNGQSGSQALYNNTITYQLANPLTLTFNLGILHDPSAIWGDKKFSDNSVFLPSGYLDWRPSDNFRLSVGFERIPSNYFSQNRMGRYWYLQR